jgi:UPF0755 protein
MHLILEKIKEFKNFKIFFITIALAFSITSLILFSLYSKYSKPVGNGQNKYELIIEEGQGSYNVSRELKNNKMLHSIRFFQILLKINSNTNKIKHGIYEINDGMTANQIMDILVSGKVKMINFTIPEGFHNRQIAELLFTKKLIESKEKFFEVASDINLLGKYKIPAQTVEGYLFPETYTIPLEYSTEKIIEMMIKRFYKNLSSIEESKNLSPEELHKKVIMASIVEREAKKKEEQPLMAGVFEKRYKINMAFESCATVQYLFEKPKKRLLEKDLLIESDYNTYLHKGYPPGPISNPGLPALKAAFSPIESDNLFFLVKPDGSHYFSKTHKEHLDAKKKYIDILYQ